WDGIGGGGCGIGGGDLCRYASACETGNRGGSGHDTPARMTTKASAQPKRCAWVNADDDLMREYHDREWGVPVHDDRKHFEFLMLEGAQAGLSWSTVLKKREAYRRAFSDFDPTKVARYTAARTAKLLTDPGIIRNRAKIASAVKNAKAFLAVQKEFGSFDAYCWGFVDGRPLENRWKSMRDIPAKTAESDAFSRDLNQRGFPFTGTAI